MSYASAEDRRVYAKNWARARRAAFMAGKFCVVCGTTERLELDHIDPATKISHAVWSWSQPRREAELAKCQVLCHQHHKEKTRSDWDKRRKHGASMYSDYGCRCAECRAGNAAKARAYKGRKQGL